MKKLIAMAVLPLVLFVSGCSDKIMKAAQATRELAGGMKIVQTAEIAAYHNHAVTKEEHVRFQKYMKDAALAGDQLADAILVAKDKPKATVALDQALKSVQALTDKGVLTFHDENTRAAVMIAVSTVRGYLATIAVAVS